MLCFILECCNLLWEMHFCNSESRHSAWGTRPKISCHFAAMRERPSGKFRGWEILVFYLALITAIQAWKTLSGLKQIKFPDFCTFFCCFWKCMLRRLFLEQPCVLCAVIQEALSMQEASILFHHSPLTGIRQRLRHYGLWPSGSLRWRLRLAPRNCRV